MKKSLICLCLSMLVGATTWAAEVKDVKSYVVQVPEEFYVEYSGAYQNNFPKGFEPGHGSALALKRINEDGSIEFYGLSDRGPNADGPMILNNPNKSGKIFPAPKFVPEIGVIKFVSGKAMVTEKIALRAGDCQKITGLPVIPGTTGATGETALDDLMKVLPYDVNGMDPEGLAIDKEGNFWISDEYGPFVAKFSPEGKLLKKMMPGQGLPDILKYRTPNRGMEGLTITPSGKYLWGAMQSVLDIEGQTGKTGQFTRLVRIDIATGVTQMFAYPINSNYKNASGAKIGDVYALNDGELLLIEQGADRNGVMTNQIFKVSIGEATDLSNFKINGLEAEFAVDTSALQMAEKELLVDLRQQGWKIEKAEGITLLPDRKTIVVINDNDFGLALSVKDNLLQKAKVTDYTFDNAKQQMMIDGKVRNPQINLSQNSPDEAHVQLWFIEMRDLL